MEQLNKVNQDNMLYKKQIKRKLNKSSISCQSCPKKSGISN